MNGDHTGAHRPATAQGPMKPYPPPQLHGHTVIGLPGDVYVAVLPWINEAERALTLPAGGSRPYALIAPNVAIYPRTDPTPPQPPAPPARSDRIVRGIQRGLVVAVVLALAAPWLVVAASIIRTAYGLYSQAIVRFFLG